MSTQLPFSFFLWLRGPQSLTNMIMPSQFGLLEETCSRTSRNLRKQIILCTQTRFLIRFGSPNFPLRTSICFCCFRSSSCVSLWLFTSIYLDYRFLIFIFVYIRLLSVCLFICLFVCCVLFYVFVLSVFFLFHHVILCSIFTLAKEK